LNHAAVGIHLLRRREKLVSHFTRRSNNYGRIIDSHDREVAACVWDLFDSIISQCGPISTLIEWDSNIPEWPVLRAEALAAQAILDPQCGIFQRVRPWPLLRPGSR
jgi:uncharacterized protein (UPF0276 family)